MGKPIQEKEILEAKALIHNGHSLDPFASHHIGLRPLKASFFPLPD